MVAYWPELLMAAVGLLLYLPTVMVDAALALATRSEVHRHADAGNHAAQVVQRTLDNRRRWVISAMLMRVAGLLLLGMVVARALQKSALREAGWPWLLAALLVWLLLVLVQLAVRLVVQRQPTTWALRLAPWIEGVLFLLSPMAWALRGVSEQLRFGLDEEEDSILLSDDGTRLVLPNDGEESEIEESEKEMIASILEMNETVVREVMVPRTSMVALDENTPLSEAVEVVLRAGHSRIPVFHGSIDQIIGFVYAKDLLRAYSLQNTNAPLRALLRPASFVPLTKKVRQLLAEMQKQRVHIAIVADEYGGTAGLVTIEDILEEIVGEIRDEFDSAEEAMSQAAGSDIWLLSGRFDLHSLGKLLDVDFDDEEAESVGGLLQGRLGRVAQPFEELEMFGWRFTVLAVEGRRIRTVRVERIAPPETAAGGGDQTASSPAAPSAAPAAGQQAASNPLRVSQVDRGA